MKIKFLPLALIFCASFSLKAQNVAINTTGNVANSSAMLDVESTTKGMLIPRMTAAQKDLIATPATGLLIYQTDGTSGFYFNQGTPAAKSWILLGGVANNSITTEKIANNAVTVAKLPSGATNSTFLRGDGTWASPSGGSSSKFLFTTFTTGKSFSAASPDFEDLIFSTPSANTTGGTYSGGVFTVAETGHYQISVTLENSSGNILPKIVTTTGQVYGTIYLGGATPGTQKASGSANGVFYLEVGNTIKIQIASIGYSTTNGGPAISSTSPSRLFIQKL